MTVDEFSTALSDLETRVDRLRALYENWFRGYEKLEPGVARKDVERRVYGLRKELPRNTALRFRYHQLYQRYTTLATYWQRTARQIEEGTYRRQLQRIKRRRDDDLARTLAPPPRGVDEDGETNPPPAFELNLDETLDVRNLLDELDLDQVASAIDGGSPRFDSLPPGKTTDALAAHVRGASTGRLSVPSAAAIGPVLGSPTPPKPEAAPAAPRAMGRFARPNANAGEGVAGVGQGGQRLPASAPANDVARPPSAPAAAKPPTLPTAARAVPPPPPGTGTAPMPPRAPGALPPPPPAAARKSSPGTGSFGIPPPPGRIPAPPSRPAAAQPSPPPAPSAPATSFDDQRMRRIYEEYSAAKRKNNEAEVRFETLAGSIQKMLPDLNKRHQGKQIDFEVVMKDGRVGLKPKAT